MGKLSKYTILPLYEAALNLQHYVAHTFFLLTVFSKFEPPDGKNISNVSCNSSQIAVAVGKDLYYIEIRGGSLELIW